MKQKNSYLIKEQIKAGGLDKKASSFFTHNQSKRAFRLENDIFIEQEKIGSGSFSDVYLYKKESDGSFHALKILKDNTSKDALIQECKIMRDVQSQFVIKIEEIIQIDDQLCIMIEYANQGTLESFISKISQQTMSVSASQILDLACDIFQGLNILHTKKIVHRDLKMENLLVSNYQTKIADLGVATYLISKSYAKTNIGNILYAAPEKLNEKYNSASDIYSAGLIILQIIIGITSFEILKIKMSQNYTSKINDSPENLQNFIKQLLDSNPQSRPSAIDAYNSCRMLKYDQEVLNYINNKINGANPNFSGAKSFQVSQQTQLQGQKLFSTEAAAVSNLNSLKEEQLFEKAFEFYRFGDYTQAEKYFSMILEKNPVSVKGLSGKLICDKRYKSFINMKQYSNDWFQDQLKFIKQLNQNDYMYYFCLGVINSDLDAINQSLKLNPAMAEALAWKASLMQDQKNKQEVIQLGQQALEMSENSAQVFHILGYIYSEINLDVSEKFYQRCLSINPNFYIAYNNLAYNYRQKNEFDKALEFLNKALSIAPYFKLSLTQKMDILSMHKVQHKEVIEQIEKLFSEHGEQAFLFFRLAYSYQETQNYTQALLYYIKSLSEDEESEKGNILHNIATVYVLQNDYEKAKDYFLKAIEQNQKPSYRSLYLLLRDNFNQEKQGEKYLHQLLDLEFDINDEDDCKIKIEGLTYLKKYQQALTHSELSLKQHPQSQILSNQILILISNPDFDQDLYKQFQISEIIQKNFGISQQSTLCQVKYFKAQKMDELVVTKIIKYYEEMIRTKQEFNNYALNNFEQYIDDHQLEQIFQSLKKMCESDSSNIYSQTYFLGLMFHNVKFKFSPKMLSDLEKVYNNNNKLFKNYPNQYFLELTRINYLFSSQIYYLNNNERLKLFSFNKFKDALKQIDKADIQVKKKYKIYHQLQQKALETAIQFLEEENKNQKEIESFKNLKSQKLKESQQYFPDLDG
ncbi:hypothetical protein ABPG74_006137 [Tetrahymena malaccensis]